MKDVREVKEVKVMKELIAWVEMKGLIAWEVMKKKMKERRVSLGYHKL
jgi:hypothetical protein